MVWEKWQQNGKKFFHIFTITLFSLLLPLSFILLSRLSVANYLLSLAPSSQTDPYSLPIFILFRIGPTILYFLVSLMSSFTLIHTLTSQTTSISLTHKPVFPMCISWFLLCMFQVSVGLGIEAEGTLAVGINDLDLSHKICLFSRVVFFLGLHETMTYWSRIVVKPVVDDTLLEMLFTHIPTEIPKQVLGYRKEGWMEKFAMAMGLGGLWWWRLKGEVQSLVIMVQVKKRLMIGVGLGDVIGWWLYYLTVTIGLVKFAKLIMWFALILLFKKVETNTLTQSTSENNDKV